MKTTNKKFLYRLSLIRKRAFSFLENELKKSGILDVPASYGDIIYIIHKLGRGYVKDIAELSYRDKSTVSTIINNLLKKGYVEKISDLKDGRRVRVQLTQKAEKYIKIAPSISLGLQEKLFFNMSEEEQNILFMLLDKVEKNLEK